MVRKGRVGRDLQLKPSTLQLPVSKGSPGNHPGVEPEARDDLEAGVFQLEDGHLPALILHVGFTAGAGSEENQKQLQHQSRFGWAHGQVKTGLVTQIGELIPKPEVALSVMFRKQRPWA